MTKGAILHRIAPCFLCWFAATDKTLMVLIFQSIRCFNAVSASIIPVKNSKVGIILLILPL